MEPSETRTGPDSDRAVDPQDLARSNARTLLQSDIRIFSSASDAPRARRPTDAVLLILAVLTIIVSSFIAPGPTTIGATFTRLITELPGLLGWFWEIAYDLLIFLALFLLVTALLARRRKRLFFEEVLAAVLAAGFGSVAGMIAGTEWSSSLKAIGTSHPPAIYPAMRLAVMVAVIATASPHMARPLRYLGRWVIAIGALAGIALGIAQPVGVIAGYAVGVGAAAFVHLLRGSPGGGLSLDQVATALAALGVEATDLSHAPLAPSGVALVLASTRDHGSLLVKIYGRDAWDGQLLGSIWTSIWHRGEAPPLGLSRREQVEHEAFVTLLAERSGVAVLPVVAAGMAQHDAVLVIVTTGRPLSALEPDEIDSDLLSALWANLSHLHALEISHGRPDGARIVIRPDGSPALGDFGRATVSANDDDVQRDRAQLLVATALLTGHERAVRAAAASIGNEALGDLLPFLQSAVLDRTTRQALRDQGWSLDDLRKLAANISGIELPELEKIRRVTWGSLLGVALIAFVAYVIISAVAEIGLQSLIDEFKGADGIWLWGALLLSPVVQVPQAFATIGSSVRPIRFGPVLMLEYAIQFIALALPSSAARIALEVRFFERNGIAVAGAIAIGVIDSICGFGVQVTLILGITLSGLASLDLSSRGSSSSGSSGGFPYSTVLLVLAVLLLLAVIIALAVPKYRAIVQRMRMAAGAKVAEGRAALQVLRSPSKLVLIFGGNFVAQIVLATILGLCLAAFGHHVTFADLILVNTLVTLFAGFMPVPGGMGVAEAGYTAAFVALGIPHAAAFSTAIAFRIVTYYLPPIWGGVAMRWLRRHEYL